MHDMMKRGFTLILVFALCLSLSANTVFALDAGGTDADLGGVPSNTDPPETMVDTDISQETNPISPMTESAEGIAISSTALSATVNAMESTAVVVYTNDLQKLHYTKPGHSYDYTRQFAAVYQVAIDDSGILYNAYCVEPWNGIEDHDNYSGYEGTMDQISGEIGDASPDPSPEQMEAIGLVMLYGAHELPTKEDPEDMYFSKTRLAIATQLIIWEICCNDRASGAPYTRYDSKWYDAFIDDYNGCYYSSAAHSRTGQIMGIDKVYEELAFRLENHYTIPSFATDQKSDVAACTYKMTGNGDGTYSITLTDTNGVLDYFTFADGDGLTYSIKGNQLTITADSTFVSGSIQSAIKHIPVPEKSSYFLWANGDEQKLCSVSEAKYDPLPAYFALELDTGTVEIEKTTSDGDHLEGWEFFVYSDEACTDCVAGPLYSDGEGKLKAQLVPGTFWVKETGHADAAIAQQYRCEVNPQKVTMQPGETQKLVFHNERLSCTAKIMKTLENPEAGSLAGWVFDIYKAPEVEGTIILEHLCTVTTDENGVILQELEPGPYMIVENLEGDYLWKCTSEAVKVIVLNAGETVELSFSNALRPAKIQICKVDTQGNPLEGVEFLLEWSGDEKNWKTVTYTDSEIVQMGGCTAENLVDGKLRSGPDGNVIFSGLHPTLQYRLTEIKTLDGFQILEGYAFEGTIPVDVELSVVMTVVNARTFTLPETGSRDFLLVPIGLSVSALMLAGSLYTLRRKKA